LHRPGGVSVPDQS